MNVLTPGSHKLTANGATLAYHVHGEGPVVIALPGGPGFSHRYLRSPMLEARAKVVYLDPIGTGASARLSSPTEYSRARDVADIEALRVHLDLERIALLGHSSGGFLAQLYAITHPSQVDRIVLFDTTPTNREEFDASLQKEMAARSDRPWFPTAASALRTIFTQRIGEEEMMALGKQILPFYLADPEHNARLLDVLSDRMDLNPVRLQQAPPVPFDYRPELSKLDVKALVLVGAHDFICAPVLARSLHESLRGSRLVLLERSGHMGHLEEPETFATTVASFL